MTYYITSKSSANVVLHPIEACISYEKLSSSYKTYLGALSSIMEPQSFHEASKNQRWVEVMQTEIQALQDSHTWELVKLPEGKRLSGCKWVYKVKLQPNGEVERFKARLVAKGPDIAFLVQTLIQFLHQPKKSHWDATIRVVRYIKREHGLRILLGIKSSNRLSVFCDADWASYPNTRISVSGFLIKYGEFLVSWKSKKQNTVSKSSVEEEYKSMASAISEVV
ncbi:secreted RxLR effector protein 161-like [Nicotiana tabacum]|uniref:Secreted RxLR effector protein 161-like n=1 Tax=Nicotiana tabacum TaxID=4097 RepID=A0AC58T3A9_TOBAC